MPHVLQFIALFCPLRQQKASSGTYLVPHVSDSVVRRYHQFHRFTDAVFNLRTPDPADPGYHIANQLYKDTHEWWRDCTCYWCMGVMFHWPMFAVTTARTFTRLWNTLRNMDRDGRVLKFRDKWPFGSLVLLVQCGRWSIWFLGQEVDLNNAIPELIGRTAMNILNVIFINVFANFSIFFIKYFILQ